MEGLIIINDRIKNLWVRLEGDLCAGVVGAAHNSHLLGDIPPGKLHFIDLTVFVDPHCQPNRQSIDHRSAHAMETAGNLIAAAAKFSSGMQDGIDHLQGRAASLRLNIHGNAPSVVGDGDGLSWIDGDGNMLAVPGQSFVNGIVHDLIDQQRILL